MYYENNNDAVNVLACACALRQVTTTVVVVRSTGGCDPKTAAVPPMAGALAGGSCHMATASRARRAAVVRHGTRRRRRVGLAREPDAHARTRRTRATRACTGSWPRVITSTTSVRGRVVERGGLVSIVARGAPSTDPPPPFGGHGGTSTRCHRASYTSPSPLHGVRLGISPTRRYRRPDGAAPRYNGNGNGRLRTRGILISGHGRHTV